MRGNYQTTHEDRKKFFHGLCELCKNPTTWHDLVSTQLSMCNCVDLLEELGYDQEDWDVNGWEGDVWGHYCHTKWNEETCQAIEDAPTIWVRAEAYSGSLDIGFSGIDDDKEIDTEALKELMREHWGKYFPVI
jgi:hypothetical protein